MPPSRNLISFSALPSFSFLFSNSSPSLLIHPILNFILVFDLILQCHFLFCFAESFSFYKFVFDFALQVHFTYLFLILFYRLFLFLQLHFSFYIFIFFLRFLCSKFVFFFFPDMFYATESFCVSDLFLYFPDLFCVRSFSVFISF